MVGTMNLELGKQALAAIVGGGIGTLLRFLAASWVLHTFPQSKFPWSTLGMNLLGCLVIGLLYGWASDRWFMGLHMRHLLLTGVLGGFTTFSAFGIETVMLMRRGETVLAGTYVLTSVVGGLILAWAGDRISAALSA